MGKNDRGIALLIALIVAVLLSLLALSVTMSSLNESRISGEFENHEKALLVADAGFSTIKTQFRGSSLSQLLARTSSIPNYIPDPSPRPYSYRNPINLIEARNIAFDSPPAAGARTDRGWLTPPAGMVVGGGRVFAKLSDNLDDADPLNDSDGTVVLRVMGIYQGLASETSSYGTTRKNSVAIIEATLRRDETFKLQAPMTIPAADCVTPFGGAKFKVDGYDHSSIWDDTSDIGGHSDNNLPNHPGVNIVYDNPPNNSSGTVDEIVNSLKKNEKDNFTGIDGVVPAIVDGTEEVKANPDAQNILNAQYLENFVRYVTVFADEKVPPGQSPTGGLGTKTAPRMIVAEGDLKLTGNAVGYGLLVVKGELELKGTFEYNGMLLVIGQGNLNIGGSASVLGGVLVANITASHTLGTATFSDHGGGNPSAGIYNSSEKIQLALSLLPMRSISWREITPEVEP